MPFLCWLLFSVMLTQCFPNGLNDIWGTDCSRSWLPLKQLPPPFGFYKHYILKTEVMSGGFKWPLNHNQRGLFMILNIFSDPQCTPEVLYQIFSTMVILFQFVPQISFPPLCSLSLSGSVCRVVIVFLQTTTNGIALHWLYGTRKWSEWAFNYFIANAGCQEGKDMIGFDYRVTAAEKKCISDFCQQSAIWEDFINYSIFRQMYHFELK